MKSIALLGAALVLVAASGCSMPQSAGTLVVWVVDGSRGVAADALPALENEVYSASRGGVSLRAARNETVGLQVAMNTNLPPAGPYTVRISDLVSSGGRIDAAEHVRLFRVHDVRVENFRSWYPEHTGRSAVPIDVPDVLVPWGAPRGGGPLRLDDGRTRAIWVDVFVPPQTPPGEYRGTLSLVAQGIGGPSDAAAFTTSLRLEVVDIEIPAARGLTIAACVDPRELLAAHYNWPIELAEETRILPDLAGHQNARQLIGNTMKLLHEHRLTPVLWASFPKYKVTGERGVEIDWESYDALVSGFIDGSSYADGAPAAAWALPISMNYPDAARNGGFASPRYSRMLASYLAECRRHFEERGWLDRALLRMVPPAVLTADAVEQSRRLGGIVKQSGIPLPLLSHLPAESLRTLGWFNAPPIDLPETAIWCPPADWWTPDAMARERSLGRRTWFVPGTPPYSASLLPEAPATDARSLAWQAYRYEADGIWLENAVGDPKRAARVRGAVLAGTPLTYPGADYGINDAPVPSIRLKRLRRGALDVDLLKQLDARGQSLLARRAAEELVRWAFVDAAAQNLVTTRGAGWNADPYAYSLARETLISELTGAASPTGASQAADWARFIESGNRTRIEMSGARLEVESERLLARLFYGISNSATQSLTGTWALPQAPAGWALNGKAVSVAGGARAAGILELEMASLAYNEAGVFTLPTLFDTESGAFQAVTRLAVAAAPLVERPIEIDAKLSDWPAATNNAAAQFRLVRGIGAASDGVPTLPTRAMFCMDGEALYIAVDCSLPRGDSPQWRSDTEIPIDGAIPWGQDVVEILISPRDPLEASPADLLTLQIKPNALLSARRGARTDPPMCAVSPWPCNARAAADVRSDGWSVEVAIPLSAFDAAALRRRVWGVNVTRLDARRGEYSSWSGARGNCYLPESLGNLVLQQP